MKQCACLFILTAALRRTSHVSKTASLVFILLTACQPSRPSLPPTFSVTHVIVSTMTPSPVPTKTFTPSPTPTIEELIFPYTIKGLRQHDFQSGKIHIRSTLDDQNE